MFTRPTNTKKGTLLSGRDRSLFISIVLPNFSYTLSVYEASESDLTVIQNFLDRCHKRRFISFPVFIKSLLNKQDRNILKKLIPTDFHPLKDIIPVQKTYVHNLRKKGCVRPKINTQRFMNTFVNRLIFIASFECKTLTILTLKCTSHGYMYCPH